MSWASGRSRVTRYAVRIARTWCRRTRASSPRMSPRCKCSIGWKVSAVSSPGRAVMDRQADREGTAVTLAAVDGQGAAMLGDDLERHCQADTAAANARDIMRSLDCFN